jgi:hypothetical protein
VIYGWFNIMAKLYYRRNSTTYSSLLFNSAFTQNNMYLKVAGASKYAMLIDPNNSPVYGTLRIRKNSSNYAVPSNNSYTGASASVQTLYPPAYGNGYVVASKSDGSIRSSGDGGASWTTYSPGLGATLSSVIYSPAQNRFIIVKYNSPNSYYSTDGGANWSAGGALPSTALWQWGAQLGSYGIFGINATGATSYTYTSNGGTSWSSGTWPVAGKYMCFGYYAGVYSVFNSTTGYFYYSTGINGTWTQSTNFGVCNGEPAASVAGHAGLLSGMSSTQYAHTANGTTWTARTSPYSYPTSICYGNGQYVMLGANTVYYYSYDGINWNTGSHNSSLTGQNALGSIYDVSHNSFVMTNTNVAQNTVYIYGTV